MKDLFKQRKKMSISVPNHKKEIPQPKIEIFTNALNNINQEVLSDNNSQYQI